MELEWLEIHPLDPIWIAIAFAMGMIARAVKLAPLVGFLLAGFLLGYLGAEPGVFLETVAQIGITLLLFTVGLKLRLRSLVSTEIAGVAATHMALAVALFSAVLFLIGPILAFAGLEISGSQYALVAFALSFSSTVFAVKVLSDGGAERSRHGQVAIGVLVVQDLAAVIYLAASTGKAPSAWALLLVLLIPMRPLLHKIVELSGHGELLVLFGITAALAGSALFEAVGLKGDLGALVAGLLVAGSPKTDEISNALLSFKDIFLIGFFLSIGMIAPPSPELLLVSALLLLMVPLKSVGFFMLFLAARLRARTSWQASLNLATFSEFGLIVLSAAVLAGDIDEAWLTVLAIVIAASFALAAPIATHGDEVFTRHRLFLKRFERADRKPGDQDLSEHDVDVLVLGMGRLGSHAYEAVDEAFDGRVLGVDLDPTVVSGNVELGRRVVVGDASDPDFWSRAHDLIGQLQWVLLTTTSHGANLAAAVRLRDRGFTGRIAATSRYPDDAADLKAHGVDFAFDVFAEAGSGFALDLEARFADRLWKPAEESEPTDEATLDDAAPDDAGNDAAPDDACERFRGAVHVREALRLQGLAQSQRAEHDRSQRPGECLLARIVRVQGSVGVPRIGPRRQWNRCWCWVQPGIRPGAGAESARLPDRLLIDGPTVLGPVGHDLSTHALIDRCDDRRIRWGSAGEGRDLRGHTRLALVGNLPRPG